MSSKSKEKVKNILERLALDVVGVENIPDLARHMDYTKQTLYGWVADGKIPIKSVKSKIPNVNPYFLKDGEGEPLLKSENTKREEWPAIYDDWDRIVSQVNDEGISYEDRDQLIAVLQDRIKNLSQDLAIFYQLVENLKALDRKDSDSS